jgi:hypothetical protein
MYHRVSDTGTIIFALHINNIIATSSSTAEMNHFKAELKFQWEISNLGPVKFALEISITCDPSTKTISISQSAFINRFIDKFHQTNSHPCDTPMVAGLQLHSPNKLQSTPPNILEWMQCTPYHELVSSLNYLAIATHSDIAFAVGWLASFMDCYRVEH